MFYLGIDVAKAKIDCCLILDNSTSKKKTKTFSNTQNGFEQLQIWLNHHAATSMQTITWSVMKHKKLKCQPQW